MQFDSAMDGAVGARSMRKNLTGSVLGLIILFLFSWSLVSPATAWNATGHELVAIIAYAQLDDETRAKVDKILSNRFVTAATWADQFKARDVHLFDEWHYIDEPPNKQNVVWAIQETEAILESK